MALDAAYATGSAVSVSTTPISLINGTSTIASATDEGVYQVMIDCSAMAAGDQYRLLMYEKAIAGGTQRSQTVAVLTNAQSDPLLITGAFHLANGWDFSLTKLAGTYRAFSWSVRRAS